MLIRYLPGHDDCRCWLVASGDLLQLRESHSLYAPGSEPSSGPRLATVWMRPSTGSADYMTTGLVFQDGFENGVAAGVGGTSPERNEPAPGKDPL